MSLLLSLSSPVKFLPSAVPRHVALATSYRGLLTEEILQVNTFSTTEQGPMRTPVPLNFNVDPKTGVASSIWGRLDGINFASWKPELHPNIEIGGKGAHD